MAVRLPAAAGRLHPDNGAQLAGTLNDLFAAADAACTPVLLWVIGLYQEA